MDNFFQQNNISWNHIGCFAKMVPLLCSVKSGCSFYSSAEKTD